MKKPLLVVLVLVLALAALPACAHKVNDPADVQAVTQTVEAFAKAMNAGDADGLVAMMTDKTIYADNHFPVAVGKAAVKPMYAAQFSMFNAEFQAPVDEVRVVGDTAVCRGTWRIKLTPKAEALAPIVDSGSWMALSSRQADGSWKWEWLVPNSDQPLPGATADGAEEQAIVKIEQDWAAAMVKGDVAVLESNLAKEWTLTEDGQVTSRAQALGALKSGAYKVESATLRDLRVFVAGDAAIATMVVETKGTFMGKPVPPMSRSTDFFVKRDGQWQAVSTQNTAIK
jgi:ketosteroid isomerase-like protein